VPARHCVDTCTVFCSTNREGFRVAQLSPRTESFISLLLTVTGRARVADLQGVSPADAAELLQAYAAGHPQERLSFDGQSLAYGVSGAASPQSVAPAQPPAAPVDASSGGAPAEPPAPDPFAVPAHESFPPAAAPEALGATIADPAVSAYQEQPAPAGVPPIDWSQVAPVPDFPAPAAPEAAVPAQTDYAPPADPGFAELDSPAFAPAEMVMPDNEPVPWFWWVIAIVFAWLGGLIGWLVLRKGNPKGARNVLLVGIASTLLTVLIAVGAVTLGGMALFGAASSGSSQLAPISVTPSSTTGTPTQ
jgi:hypothetical protein